MPVADRATRISLPLRSEIPIERLILERLQSLTQRTRQQWLRSLVVEGFLLECRMLHNTAGRWSGGSPVPTLGHRPMPPSAPYALQAAPRSTGNPKPSTLGPTADPTVAATPPSNAKPFAYLRRVIG